jgi:hypothetical protein
MKQKIRKQKALDYPSHCSLGKQKIETHNERIGYRDETKETQTEV